MKKATGLFMVPQPLVLNQPFSLFGLCVWMCDCVCMRLCISAYEDVIDVWFMCLRVHSMRHYLTCLR